MTPEPIIRERLLTPEDVAEWLRVDRKWVVRHAAQNGPAPKLPGVKLGVGIRFRREDIEQFIREQFAAARQKAPQGSEIGSPTRILRRRHA